MAAQQEITGTVQSIEWIETGMSEMPHITLTDGTVVRASDRVQLPEVGESITIMATPSNSDTADYRYKSGLGTV